MQVRVRVGILCLLAVLLGVTGGTVSAHAKLIKASPAPNSVLGSAPAQVQMWFDEPVDLSFTTVQVLDSNKQRVDTETVQAAAGDPNSIVVPLKPAGDGNYNVIWQVLSASDGHITRGVFAFGVGNTAGNVAPTADAGVTTPDELSPVSAVIRWVSLLSLLALVGGFIFRFFLLERSLEAVEANKTVGTLAHRRWAQLVTLAFVVFFLSHLAELALQANSVAGQVSFTAIVSILTATRYGTLWLLRGGLLAVCALLVFLEERRVRVPYVDYAMIVLGNVALFTRSLNSHSAASGNFSLPVIADWLHLLGVAIWVGGLVYFAWLMPWIWRALELKTRSRWIAWLVPQFSIAAIGATLVIGVTGVYSALGQVPQLDSLTRGVLPPLANLVNNTYNDALGLKVALFVVMLGFGAVNLLILSPRFRKFVAAPEQSARLFTRFRLTVGAEVLLGLTVIFLAGVLTLSAPPRSIPDQPTPAGPREPIVQGPVILVGYPDKDVKVQLELGPQSNAPDNFTVKVTDPADKPLSDIQRVIFNFMYLNEDTGAQNLNADVKSATEYVTAGNYLSLDGMWKIKVTVRRKGLDDVAVEFPYYIAPRFAATDRTPVMTAQLALAKAQQTMNALKALRSTQQLNDGVNGVAISDYEYQAPDKTRFSIEGQGSSIAIGANQYFQDKNGQWTERARVENFVFPQFNFADAALSSKLARTDKVNGQDAQIILFDNLNTSGTELIHYAYWIDQSTQRVLQFGMVTSAHYMMQYYRDFDAPDIAIDAPANIAPAPTAAPVGETGTSPLTTAVQGSPRPRGWITGDLEGDGALIMVVAGVVVLLVGSGGKRPRRSRLVTLGMGAAAILVGVGLFIDAVNGTAAAAQNVPVNASRAATGQQIYEQNCLACHGVKGYGDGPGAASLPVKPFDLTTHVLLHDEQYLYATILNGRGYMPAFGSRLSQDQILDVIAYARLLARNAQQGNGTTTPARAGFTPQP